MLLGLGTGWLVGWLVGWRVCDRWNGEHEEYTYGIHYSVHRHLCESRPFRLPPAAQEGSKAMLLLLPHRHSSFLISSSATNYSLLGFGFSGSMRILVKMGVKCRIWPFLGPNCIIKMQ
jgi:hypothetical protein